MTDRELLDEAAFELRDSEFTELAAAVSRAVPADELGRVLELIDEGRFIAAGDILRRLLRSTDTDDD